MATAEAILAELEVFGVKLGLDSTRQILRAMGSPEAAYPVVLVGGTNGKGSVSTVLAEILRTPRGTGWASTLRRISNISRSACA